ncbi:MAG TPA: UrcA family protein [Steroidobacteraceae bacterium]|nr:UrcA family protein [Steroidobacteraceae bacterium]
MTLSTIVQAPAEHLLRVSRPKITLAMILCGIVSATAMGAASAATPDNDAPAVIVKYRPDSVQTDAGARILYRRIVAAAEQVCPLSAGRIMVTGEVRHCRDQAIARAVLQVNDPRLAAIHAAASRHG